MDGPTPSSQSLPFQHHGSGHQFGALPESIQNNNTGSGTQNIYTTPPQTLLHSLSFQEMDNRFKDIGNNPAAEGTCEWLLQHGEYKAWATRDRSLLWIKGKPGSGKSTLLHHAFKNVKKTAAEKDDTIFLSFFFHGRGGELQQSLLGFFQSLLHQLLQHVPKAPADMQAAFDKNCKNHGEPGKQWKWHLTDLHEFFQPLLKEVLKSRSIWLFVDALDECGEDGAGDLVKDFESWLQDKDIDSDHPSPRFQFRICFSCRHYPIQAPDYRSICVEEENTKDISTYVHTKLSGIPDDIREIIIGHASGVFMWVRLIGEEIRESQKEGDSWEKIKRNIVSSPKGLSELYARLVQRMKEKKTRSDSLKLVQWICFATRPLSLSELRWAMVIDAEVDSPRRSLEAHQSPDGYISDNETMEKKVKSLSCGIVEIMQPSQRVQFIHQSVKDYFLNEGLSTLEDDRQPQIISRRGVEGRAHYQLSRICIRYFFMEEIRIELAGVYLPNKSFLLKSKFPLFQYAVTSWMSHARQSEALEVSQDDLLEYFEWPSNKLVNTWLRANHPSLEEKSASLVHILSQFSIRGPLRKILQGTKKYINIRDSDNQTPLFYAAKNGNEAIVRLLLTIGNNDTSTDNDVRQSLFMWARSKYPFDSEVVDVNATDDFGLTPLSIAARDGHVAVVKLLLETGKVDVNARDCDGQAPLLFATENGHTAVIKLLLEIGKVDVNLTNYGQTSLFLAAKGGHEAVVKLLLETGKVDMTIKDIYNQTPLLFAAKGGHAAIVKLLLETGKVDINIEDRNGRTALSYAAMWGHEAVVKLLLETGKANITTKDVVLGQTPLSYAVAYEHEAIVKLLLETSRVGSHR